LDYFHSLSLDELQEEIDAMSWIEVEKNVDYYDGSFHKIHQGDPEKNSIDLHDTGILPTIIKMCVSLQLEVSEINFIAKVLEIYYSKHTEKNQNK